MIRNTADCQADVDRFVQRVTQYEVVWYLSSASGAASCESNDEGDEGELTVLLFFSDEAYARRCQKTHFPDHEVQSMSLFDFLFRWLPGMSGDGVLAGPNWNRDLVGLELDPFEFRKTIEAALTPEQAAAHAATYRRLGNSQS
jgi:Protein of unknown function (DUF2750)